MADNSYDPDEPEGGSRRSQYLSIKQFAVIIGVIVVVLLVCYPGYREGVVNSQKVICSQNMKAIGEAMLQYTTNNNDLMPPTHNMDADGSPALVDGLPVTWASQIQPLMSTRQNFVCPSSQIEEQVKTLSLRDGEQSFMSSYGMYRGLSSVPIAKIPNPTEVIAVAETSNLGSRQSDDPVPFGGSKPDGFLIAWDNGNLEFTSATKKVTRISFFNELGRHKAKGIGMSHAVSADGGLRRLNASDVAVDHARPRLKGLWWADPNLYK